MSWSQDVFRIFFSARIFHILNNHRLLLAFLLFCTTTSSEMSNKVKLSKFASVPEIHFNNSNSCSTNGCIWLGVGVCALSSSIVKQMFVGFYPQIPLIETFIPSLDWKIKFQSWNRITLDFQNIQISQKTSTLCNIFWKQRSPVSIPLRCWHCSCHISERFGDFLRFESPVLCNFAKTLNHPGFRIETAEHISTVFQCSSV